MMHAHSEFLVRVISDYQAPYPDPIQSKAGDDVVVDPEKQTDIAGWVWCTNSSGRSGWVPKTYVEYSGKAGIMRCDYNAIELTVHIGEVLTVHKSESGFYWASDPKGLKGWVPISHVESCENERQTQ